LSSVAIIVSRSSGRFSAVKKLSAGTLVGSFELGVINPSRIPLVVENALSERDAVAPDRSVGNAVIVPAGIEREEARAVADGDGADTFGHRHLALDRGIVPQSFVVPSS
jgi:hypothetical protein